MDTSNPSTSKSTEPRVEVTLRPDETYCRVCLKHATIPIFGSLYADDISESFRFLSGIEISPDDKFPKHICNSCHGILKSCDSFRTCVQKTDQLLRESQIMRDVYSDIDYDEDLTCTSPESETKDQCTRCDMTFDTKQEYLDHRKSKEHKNFKVQCEICKGYYTTVYIKRHMLYHNTEPENTHICDVCGKSFVIIGALKRHIATHGLELPFKCKLCPYRGRFSDCLKIHMRKHTGEKPYACAQCPARYTNKSNLNHHLLSHKTERDFKCEDCGKGYLKKRDLELHIKVYHAGIKDHECNICGKTFGYRNQMMKHQLKVHKREKMRMGPTPLYIKADQLKKECGDDN